ncbi:hypothetical protein CEB3_c18940 [Peptococcaceae bacterium CEB3]|nr:hypothetical protein CEB3_c18940 [Peptococcaceae bacterium CEB3]
MYKFLLDSEPDDGPILLIDVQTGDRIVGESPRDMVAGYMRNFDYLDIQDGGVAAFMRQRLGKDLLDAMPLSLRRLPKFPIDYTSDRKFLEGLALNEIIGIYENDGSYRVRPETPDLPPIEHHCSRCQYDKGNEKCSQFEAWADDDGAHCVGFARPDLPPQEMDGDKPVLRLVDFGHPEVFFGEHDPEAEEQEALRAIFEYDGEDDED